MAKKIKLAIALAAIALCAVGILTACKPPKTNLELVADTVSTYQTGLWTGNHEAMDIALTVMQEEDVFLTDGLVGTQVARTQLSLRPKQVELLDKTFTYTLTGESGELKGQLTRNRLGVSFTADITGLEGIGAVQSVTIHDGETEYAIELSNRLDGMIDYLAALKIGYETFQPQIDALLGEKAWNREVYIRMIHDAHSPSGGYYWYVSFIASRDDYWAVLMTTDSGQIVSKRMHSPQGEQETSGPTTPQSPTIPQ